MAFSFFGIILFFFLVGANDSVRNILLIFITFLFAYLIALLSVFFTKHEKFGKAIKASIKKAHHFIIPVIIILIKVYIIIQISVIYKNTGILATAINLILFLIIFSWVKIYISEIAKTI